MNIFDGFEHQQRLISGQRSCDKMPGTRKRPLDVLLVESDPTEALITRRAIEQSHVEVILFASYGETSLKFLKQEKFPSFPT